MTNKKQEPRTASCPHCGACLHCGSVPQIETPPVHYWRWITTPLPNQPTIQPYYHLGAAPYSVYC